MHLEKRRIQIGVLSILIAFVCLAGCSSTDGQYSDFCSKVKAFVPYDTNDPAAASKGYFDLEKLAPGDLKDELWYLGDALSQAAERKAAGEFDSPDKVADLEQSLERINSLAVQLVPRFEAACQ